MGGEYGRSEGATAENAVPLLLNLLSTDGWGIPGGGS
jgi:hypothetical protein